MNLDPARDKSLSQRGGENKRTIKCISLRKRGGKPNQKEKFSKANEVQFVHKSKWTLTTYGRERKRPSKGTDGQKGSLMRERERETTQQGENCQKGGEREHDARPR